jgi:very-short-patch-repair endonuclease
MWAIVRNGNLGVKFRRQHRIGQFVVDFFSTEHSLAIELDGAPHFTESGMKY